MKKLTTLMLVLALLVGLWVPMADTSVEARDPVGKVYEVGHEKLLRRLFEKKFSSEDFDHEVVEIWLNHDIYLHRPIYLEVPEGSKLKRIIMKTNPAKRKLKYSILLENAKGAIVVSDLRSTRQLELDMGRLHFGAKEEYLNDETAPVNQTAFVFRGLKKVSIVHSNYWGSNKTKRFWNFIDCDEVVLQNETKQDYHWRVVNTLNDYDLYCESKRQGSTPTSFSVIGQDFGNAYVAVDHAHFKNVGLVGRLNLRQNKAESGPQGQYLMEGCEAKVFSDGTYLIEAAARLKIQDSTFTSVLHGVLKVLDGQAVLENNRFENNGVERGYSSVWIENGQVILKNGNQFLKNKALEGGAIYISSHGTLVDESDDKGRTMYKENVAHEQGGALYYGWRTINSEDEMPRVVGNFIANKAAFGGAVASDQLPLYLTDKSFFQLNEATYKGGAYYYESSNERLPDFQLSPILDGVTMQLNSAGESGGAVSIKSYAETILHLKNGVNIQRNKLGDQAQNKGLTDIFLDLSSRMEFSPFPVTKLSISNAQNKKMNYGLAALPVQAPKDGNQGQYAHLLAVYQTEVQKENVLPTITDERHNIRIDTKTAWLVRKPYKPLVRLAFAYLPQGKDLGCPLNDLTPLDYHIYTDMAYKKTKVEGQLLTEDDFENGNRLRQDQKYLGGIIREMTILPLVQNGSQTLPEDTERFTRLGAKSRIPYGAQEVTLLLILKRQDKRYFFNFAEGTPDAVKTTVELPQPLSIEEGQENVPLPELTCEGYIFRGWSSEASKFVPVTEVSYGSSMVEMDKNLYAFWTPAVGYEIKFEIHQDSAVQDVELSYTSKIGYKGQPVPWPEVKSSFYYISERLDSAGHAVPYEQTVSGPATYYLKIKERQYILAEDLVFYRQHNLDAAGNEISDGSLPIIGPDKSLDKNYQCLAEVIKALEIPGYKLEGWYAAYDESTKTFSKAISEAQMNAPVKDLPDGYLKLERPKWYIDVYGKYVLDPTATLQLEFEWWASSADITDNYDLPAPMTVQLGQPVMLPLPKLKPEGKDLYEVEGWYYKNTTRFASKDGQYTLEKPEEYQLSIVMKKKALPEEPVTPTYTVQFKWANGVSGQPAELKLPETTQVLGGMVFNPETRRVQVKESEKTFEYSLLWFKDAAATTPYTPEAVNASLTLYATYEKKDVTEVPVEPTPEPEPDPTPDDPAEHLIWVTGGVSDVGGAKKDATVTITANKIENKRFVRWEVKAGGVTLANATATETTFTMGDQDVEIEAVFEDLTPPATKYTVKVVNGTADKVEAAKGETVKITANAPAAGKQFKEWTVKAGGVTLADATAAETTFTMGEANVEVEATYEDKPVTPPAPTSPATVAAVDKDGHPLAGATLSELQHLESGAYVPVMAETKIEWRLKIEELADMPSEINLKNEYVIAFDGRSVVWFRLTLEKRVGDGAWTAVSDPENYKLKVKMNKPAGDEKKTLKEAYAHRHDATAGDILDKIADAQDLGVQMQFTAPHFSYFAFAFKTPATPEPNPEPTPKQPDEKPVVVQPIGPGYRRNPAFYMQPGQEKPKDGNSNVAVNAGQVTQNLPKTGDVSQLPLALLALLLAAGLLVLRRRS